MNEGGKNICMRMRKYKAVFRALKHSGISKAQECQAIKLKMSVDVLGLR